MNPEQLWETTLDTNARSLLQVKVKEVDEADDLFDQADGRRGRAAPRLHPGERAHRQRMRRCTLATSNQRPRSCEETGFAIAYGPGRSRKATMCPIPEDRGAVRHVESGADGGRRRQATGELGARSASRRCRGCSGRRVVAAGTPSGGIFRSARAEEPRRDRAHVQGMACEFARVIERRAGPLRTCHSSPRRAVRLCTRNALPEALGARKIARLSKRDPPRHAGSSSAEPLAA